MTKTDYDAVVVGSGPNGLAAAITLQQSGLKVLLVEGKQTIGGGLRSAELTLPGFTHDICSAIHPLALASPFFKTVPLAQYGFEFIHPDIPLAHPFDDGTSAILTRSIRETAALLGRDGPTYHRLMHRITAIWDTFIADTLNPLGFPKEPLEFARFGLNALQPASWLAKRFSTPQARGLWAGLAAHSIQPFHKLTTSAIGLVLMAAANTNGWPIPKGGAQQLANALTAHFVAIGGKIETNFYVKSLEQLPSAKAVLFDVTPRQLLKIAGHTFSSLYQWQLQRYRYGMGVFKVDWALDGPAPFTSPNGAMAGTLHLGGNYQEIAWNETQTSRGKHSEKPFVLLAQPSVLDPTRAPAGKHTLWGYCHVPNGSTKDMTEAIENQIERFAPGFRERILAKHVMNSVQMEEHNPNYVGGDINGGVIDLGQLFTRPALRWSPYRTSTKGLYLCSSSTPPGGGIHGMCGYISARRALKDLFPENWQMAK